MLPPESLRKSKKNITKYFEDAEKYGIECFPVDCFHYREFRYTSLSDAIAQARRDEESREREACHANRTI